MLIIVPLNLSNISHLAPPIEKKSVNHILVSALCCVVPHLSALLKQTVKSKRLLGVKERGGRTEQKR